MRVGVGPIEQWTWATGGVAVDPDTLTAIVRADNAGAQVEDLGNLIANRRRAGEYYGDVTDASYLHGFWYEVYATIMKDGKTWYRVFPFRFRATTGGGSGILSGIIVQG